MPPERVQPTVLVHDRHAGQFAGGVRRSSQQAAAFTVAGGRGELQVFGLLRISPSLSNAAAAQQRVALHAARAWQERVPGFTDGPLREMVDQFNRHNTIQLVIEDAELGGRRIGASSP